MTAEWAHISVVAGHLCALQLPDASSRGECDWMPMDLVLYAWRPAASTFAWLAAVADRKLNSYRQYKYFI